MKKICFILSLAFFTACNSGSDTKVDAMKTDSTASTSAMRDINSPFPIGYSSKFAVDDPKNAETLLALWKDWDNGDLLAHKDYFADSVRMYFFDGSSAVGPRDSVLGGAQAYRSTLAKSEARVDAIMATKSIDRNEHWALIWGMEKDTDKKGKVDSFQLQETWRFSSAGKAELMYQFRAKPTK